MKTTVVPKYSRWISKTNRLFVVLTKWGSGAGKDYKTTQVDLLEVNKETIIEVNMDTLIQQIDNGELTRVETNDGRL
ncbi:hypothetical protein [Solitalea canadensis]|uniref:Uncharacterized protein n=1 Tax=Solitalea canadensis (strain ATCC 29591 / DSM 3403 / JCM 21819 / LMG 8368 / NBRC 15130 / NCIMB 12057 / USAM 9D) TaxID=929556 RepID=H8KPT5_SOLCM|nr:hypothetical protein [Solitalea canadensis]AFD05983.1 hypothetical protein Solca_0868 [Solitalea canadensis DSM 3403]